jgi:hypothetical protein
MQKLKTRLSLALRAGLGAACFAWAVGLAFWVYAWILIEGGNAEHALLYLAISGSAIPTGAVMSYAAGKKSRRIEAQDQREAKAAPANAPSKIGAR